MAWCGNKPLPEPMLPQLYVYGHMASPNPIELKGCDLILIGIDRSTYQRHSPAEKIRYKKMNHTVHFIPKIIQIIQSWYIS